MLNSLKKYIRMIEKQFEKTKRRIKVMRAGGHATIQLNGSRYVIRSVSPSDSIKLFQMHQRLSKETLYFRYLAPHHPTMVEMRTICSFSVSEGAVFVAQRKDKNDTIVGLAYYRFDPTHPDENPEFAIVVEEQFQWSGYFANRSCLSESTPGLEWYDQQATRADRKVQQCRRCGQVDPICKRQGFVGFHPGRRT